MCIAQDKGWTSTDSVGILSSEALAYDVLSAKDVQAHLEPQCAGVCIELLQETESTNAVARQRAREGVPEGYFVIANAQTKGKGRRGKSFFSPPDTGLYMSLVLRPENMSIAQVTRITTMAAVAACQAIETVSGRNAQIKWVNDVFLADRKVCGILTEASCSGNNGHVDCAVLGVGINVYPPANGLPEDLDGIAGHVFDERRHDGKNRLAAEFLNRFMALYRSECAAADGETHANKPGHVQEYRRRCFVIGKQVTVLSPAGNRTALALDVDDDCRLVVRYDDGSTETLSSGEISVRIA